ncbi:MAG: hypothetical protein OXU43_00410 [Gammaproteobacteria bacterium]|nr:hypothetical protein [Gammaproteobacteria bacterium]MDD9823641.1 hypothetical protein [Gammaproteobacteria bacterium]
MTLANVELLEALEVAGVPKEKARAAAASVAAAGEAATKADLAELKAELTVRMTLLVAPLYVLFAYLAIRVS